MIEKKRRNCWRSGEENQKLSENQKLEIRKSLCSRNCQKNAFIMTNSSFLQSACGRNLSDICERLSISIERIQEIHNSSPGGLEIEEESKETSRIETTNKNQKQLWKSEDFDLKFKVTHSGKVKCKMEAHLLLFFRQIPLQCKNSSGGRKCEICRPLDILQKVTVVIQRASSFFVSLFAKSECNDENEDEKSPHCLFVDRVKHVKKSFPNSKLIYIIIGAEKWLKINSTKKENSKLPIDIQRLEDIQNRFAVDLHVHMVFEESAAKAANDIVSIFKSICIMPNIIYQKEKRIIDGKELILDTRKEAKRKQTAAISHQHDHNYLQFLETHTAVSRSISLAIADNYPSLSCLLKAYENCCSNGEDNEGSCDPDSLEHQKRNLLAKIIVSRGSGHLASEKPLGKVLSSKIYEFLFCKEPNKII
ncbi:MAG: crossover junction endonuclease eme1 [Marteilia pararefringens]